MTRPRRRRRTLATLAALAALAACSPPGAPREPARAGASAATTSADAVRDLATGLEAPWDVVAVDGSVLVSERDSARVLEVLDDGAVRQVGVVPGVVHGGEAGLLGLAVDERSRLYAYSTGADGNRIQRFALTGEPGAFALGRAETILDGLPSAPVHDGGRIAFGPDGMLYAGVGDAGRPDAAQDPEVLAGKILRMTPDGGVPDDNPVDGSLVWSLGHRNVQGLAWTADGTLVASELGQDTWDELNVVEPGANYGWPVVEGVAGDERFVDPVVQWRPDEASPSGIAVVGRTVLVANLRGAVLRVVPLDDPGAWTDHLAGTHGRLRAVQVAPDGGLWVLTHNTDGRGDPRDGDDRLLAVDVAGVTG